MTNKPSYIFSADIIRDLAIVGVVLIHTLNAVYTRLDFFGGTIWWLSIILDSIFRIAIPLFIMLSGYLILGKDESFEKSLKRLVYRILIPLIASFLFYTWWRYGKPSLHDINVGLVQKLFSVDTYHLYFLVIMLGLYFFAPLIRAYLQKSSPSSQSFFMKVLLAIGIIEVGLQFIIGSCGTENFFTRWIPYTGFFVAGYVLGHRAKHIKNNKLIGIYFLGLLATIWLNYFYYFLAVQHITILSASGCLSHYADHYLSLNVVMMSLTAFILLIKLPFARLEQNPMIKHIVHSIARTAFGIYILHLSVSRFLEIQFLLAIDFTSLPMPVYIVVKLFLVFVLSYLLTLILSKIPFLRYLIGYSK